MKRPIESDYTSLVAYTRALEEYCDALAQPEPVTWNSGIPPFYPEMKDGETISADYVEATTPAAPVQQQKPACWDGEDKCPNRQACCYEQVCLFLTPQQCKPLTLGQKQRLWSSVGDKPTLKDRVNAYGLAIEAAHNIKE